MVTEDDDSVFGYSQCRLPAKVQRLINGYGKVFLCPHHEAEFADEVLA